MVLEVRVREPWVRRAVNSYCKCRVSRNCHVLCEALACDGRADKSVAQRGIMGFEPRATRPGYIYNPERNPNVAPPDLPIDPGDL